MALNSSIRGQQIKDAFFGAGLQRNGTDADIMEVNVDDSTIEISTDALRLKDAGITTAKLADDSVTAAKLNADTAGLGLVQAAGGELDVNVDDSTLEVATDTVQIKDAGVTTAKIADDAVDSTKVDLSDTYDFATGGGTIQVGAPSVGNDVANKTYVDSVAQGLDVKDSVRATSTSNITLSGTQTIDGVLLAEGDRVLVQGQTTGSENGIYVVASGAWARSADYANGDTVASTFMFVEEGTVNADNGYVCTNDGGSDVVGTDALSYAQFSGAGSVTAGEGLSKTGNTLDVNVDDSTIEINADTLRIKDAGVTTAKLADDAVTAAKLNSDVAGLGLSQAVGGELDVNVDDSSIEINADTLRVKAGGITDTMLANDYIQTSEVDNSTIEFAGGTLNIVDAGVGTTQLANLAVTNAKIADDTIAEVKLDIFNAPSAGQILGYTANGLEWVSGTANSVEETDIAVENQSANTDGVETDFTLASTPLANSVQVFLNGLLQESGSGKDYTLTGSTISFTTAPETGDILIVHYVIDN